MTSTNILALMPHFNAMRVPPTHVLVLKATTVATDPDNVMAALGHEHVAREFVYATLDDERVTADLLGAHGQDAVHVTWRLYPRDPMCASDPAIFYATALHHDRWVRMATNQAIEKILKACDEKYGLAARGVHTRSHHMMFNIIGMDKSQGTD